MTIGTSLFAACLLCGPAFAQSADDILNQLKPTAGSLKGATRGIRPVGPAASAPAVDAAQVAPVRQHPAGDRIAAAQPPAAARASAPSVSLQVEFRSGSAELTPAAARSLDELGKALSNPQLSGYRFRIEGHTDTVGTPEANKTLSEQRAKTVSAYLAQKFGVDGARLEPIGMGEDEPAVPTGPQTPEARNRRVQIVNLGA